MSENIARFIETFTESLASGTFIKATLGNYKGADEHLQKISFRPITTKRGHRLFALYRYSTRDTAKNFAKAEAGKLIAELIDSGFKSGHLFTTETDLQLSIGKKGKSRLNTAKPTHRTPLPLGHDRAKRRFIDPNSYYLRALGITTDAGEVRDKQQDKWRQINRFIEILASLVDDSRLAGRKSLSIVDMGCGKGYLTFAAYDHFRESRGLAVSVTGVDTRAELVALCQDISCAGNCEGLRFVEGSIDSFDVSSVDILIALHACDTATDDAIHKGIRANAELIVVAPCCHREIRPQIEPVDIYRDILKHGVLRERSAEIITDGMRAMLLERCGYSVKMLEFVSVEHTPKNNMIVATRLRRPKDTEAVQLRIDELKKQFAIGHQRLDDLLAASRAASAS